MFKGVPAIHYGHNAQTIKVVEVTMQKLAATWCPKSMSALRTEIALPKPPPWLGISFCSLSRPLTALKQTVPMASKNSLGLPRFLQILTVLFASKARNSMDGNCVTCTPVFFFTMPVVDISNWLQHFLLFEPGCYKQGIDSHQLNFMHKGKTLVSLNAQECALDEIFLNVPMSTYRVDKKLI